MHSTNHLVAPASSFPMVLEIMKNPLDERLQSFSVETKLAFGILFKKRPHCVQLLIKQHASLHQEHRGIRKPSLKSTFGFMDSILNVNMSICPFLLRLRPERFQYRSRIGHQT